MYGVQDHLLSSERTPLLKSDALTLKRCIRVYIHYRWSCADPEVGQGVWTPWNCQIINFCHVEIFRQNPSGNLDPLSLSPRPPPPPRKFSGSAHGWSSNRCYVTLCPGLHTIHRFNTRYARHIPLKPCQTIFSSFPEAVGELHKPNVGSVNSNFHFPLTEVVFSLSLSSDVNCQNDQELSCVSSSKSLGTRFSEEEWAVRRYAYFKNGSL